MPWLIDAIVRRRERIEWGVAGVIVIGVALVLPRPEIVVIDGERVALIKVFGWQIPRWAQIAVGCAVVFLLHELVAFVGRRLWPIKVKVQDVHQSPDGGLTVGWIPDEPGTRSPMEYTPWVATPETTAEEFLTAEAPNPMRAMVIGDGWDEEFDDFLAAQDAWIAGASKETLHQLMPAAEGLTQGAPGSWVEEVVQRLVMAHDERGIPSREEIRALVERRKGEGIEFGFADWDLEDADAPTKGV